MTRDDPKKKEPGKRLAEKKEEKKQPASTASRGLHNQNGKYALSRSLAGPTFLQFTTKLRVGKKNP